MIPLPEPDPAITAFFLLRRFGYFALLAPLALARVWMGGPLARWPALIAAIMALGGLYTALAPAFGWTGSALYREAAQLMAAGSGGLAALLVPSVLMAISAVIADVRGKLIDRLHAGLLAALLGLWWWVS